MNINRLRSSVRRGARRGFWLGALCWAWGVQAQPAQVVQLPEVVVTATRVNTPLEDVVRDVTVLGREEIEASGASTLVELLGRLPGVVGVGDARLYIRGAEARMTAVYVDGVRVDRQDALTPGGGAPWDVLPLDDVERIEVLRGTASSLYGSDGMGGVVRIITTPTTGEGNSARASLGVGAWQQQAASVSVRRQLEQTQVGVAVSTEHHDGYDQRPDLQHTPANLAQRRQQAHAYWQWGQPDAGGRLTLGVRQGLTRQASVKVNYLNVAPWRADGTGTNFWVTQILNQWHVEWAHQDATQGMRVALNQATLDFGDTYPSSARAFKGITSTLSAQRQGQAEWGQWHAGYEGKQDRYQTQPWDYNPAVNAVRHQHALFGGLGLPLGLAQAQLDARYDTSSADTSVLTGSVSAGMPVAGWQWRGTLGSGYRLPTMSQRFSIYGSASVRPEKSVSAELSAERGDVAQGHTTVTLYQQRFDDLILDLSSNSSCANGSFCATNVERAQVDGWTLVHRQAWGAWLGALSMDGMVASNKSGGNQGKDLNLRPRLSWQASLQRQWAAVNASVDYQHVGRRFDDAANTKPLAAYGVWKLGVSGVLSPHWRWRLNVDNLTDATYETFKDYAAPGRRWSMHLVWQGG